MPPPSRLQRVLALLAGGLLVLLGAGGVGGCGGSGGVVAPVIVGPPSPLPIATLGVPYAQAISATGTAPTFSISAGALAPGLALDPVTGALAGTPLARGTFTFTVTVANAAGVDHRDYAHAVHGPVAVSEVEGNDTPATATPVALDLPAEGSLVAPGDVDVWSVPLVGGQDVELEVHATRRDPAAWDAADNRVVVTLRAPDGQTSVVTTEPGLATGAALDPDVARCRIPTTGLHFLELRTFTSSAPGGRYAFTIRPWTAPNPQEEADPNHTAATATDITPGTVFGTRDPGEVDWFRFTVAGPTIVRFETFAHRDGVVGAAADRFDPLLDLTDATGTVLLKSRDDGIFFDTVFAYRVAGPGTYALRVRSSGGGGVAGAYALRYDAVSVGAATEVEPNQVAPTQVSPLTPGTVVSGSVASGDDDVFSFAGRAGDEVHVQLLALQSDVEGSTVTVEPLTELLASDGVTPLPSSAPGPSQRIRRTVLPSTGPCFVRVSTTSLGPTPYTLRVAIPSTSTFEAEPDDTVAEALPLPNEARISGRMDRLGDVDVYAFPAVAGELIVLSLLGSVADASNADLDGWGSTIVPRLVVTDAASSVLLAADDLAVHRKARGAIPGTRRVELAFVAPATGTFFVHVSDVGFTPIAHYTLEKR